MKTFEFATYTEMYDQLIGAFMEDEYQGVSPFIEDRKGHMGFINQAYVKVQDPTQPLNMAEFGYKQNRWKLFCKQYLDPTFGDWLDNIGKTFPQTWHGYSFSTRKRKHVHGNCIYGISYITKPEVAISLHSRTVFILPTSVLELTLVRLVAERFQEIMGVTPVFHWHLSQMQFSGLWGYPWLRSHDYPLEGNHNSMRQTYQRTHRNYYRAIDGWESPYKRLRRLLKRAREILEDPTIRRVPSSIYVPKEKKK